MHFKLQISKQTLLKMKLTAVLLMIFGLHLSAKIHSQEVTLSVKDASLEKVLSLIKTQTGFTFFADGDMLAAARPVSLQLKHASLKEALDATFKDQPFNYSLEGRIITITAGATSPLSRLSFFLPATSPIKGYVTDGDGNPLVGATITVKASNISTKTSGVGAFVINASEGDVLVITFVGYDAKEIKLIASFIKNGNVGTTALMISPKEMREVEVNKGYYKTKDILNVGNVFKVSGDDIRKQPVTDPILALEGRVPGLSISQVAGIPGAPMKILLRGQNFLQAGNNYPASNDPLYIVDGIPFTSQPFNAYAVPSIFSTTSGVVTTTQRIPNYSLSPFNLLDPAYIESIDILKDADGTALYGSRGANGVILITTKKGKPGPTKVNLTYVTGSSQQVSAVKLMNTQQYLVMRKEAFKNDGTVPNAFNYDINGFWDSTRYTNWQKFATGQKAPFINSNISISGGNANTQFTAGGSYSKAGVYVPGNFGDQRLGAQFSISYRSTNERFHFDLSGQYSSDNNKQPGNTTFVTSYTRAPDAPALYDKNGNLNWQPYNGDASWANPLASINIQTKSLTTYLQGNVSLRYRIYKSLELKTIFGYGTSTIDQRNIRPSTAVAPPNNTNPDFRSMYSSSTSSKSWNNETQLSYSVKIEKHSFDALTGTTLQDNNSNSFAYNASGFANDALIVNPLNASIFTRSYYRATEYKYASIYARLGYNYDQKYILNFTGRRDGSSRFGLSRLYGNFGAVAAGWVFSKEKFIAGALPWLSFGKLRISYGTTGGDGVGDYQYLSTYTSDFAGLTGTYLGVTGLSSNGLINPYFQWQVNKKADIGVDLGFLQDRINLSASYYRNRCGNQLIEYPMPSITGFITVTTNLNALVQNSGWELVLNTANIRRKQLSWNSSINISFPQNKLISFPGLQQSGFRTAYAIGKPIYTQALYHYLGVDPQSGVYKFATKSATGTLTNDDKIFGRSVTQQYYGGINNSISYKGFTVDFFIEFKKQLGYSYQKAMSSASYPGQAYNQPSIVLNRWQKPGDITNVQKFTTGSDAAARTAYSNFPNSDGVITDASYVRFQNLAISYQLPRGFQQQLHLQGARVYMQCNNLFTITHYAVLDPETQNFLAPARNLTFGINLNF